MNRRLRLRRAAKADIDSAFDWYELQTVGLGADFLEALNICLTQIQQNPFLYPIVHRETRRAVLRRFPYSVLYLVTDNSIIVIGCFHARRNPATWLGRV
jgi:plasmid stabilization system protein ParE